MKQVYRAQIGNFGKINHR